ncbi:MAG: ferredoxin--NADP reductase [Deltaproteobacteria bacterium]|nr:ferredoxin--NADP reductase [Deltaproteobacteria bacterium]
MTWWIVGAVVLAILVLRSFRPKELSAAHKHGAAPARTLRVAGVTRETPDAVSLQLEDVTGSPVEFVAGQFLSLKFVLEGETLWRNYSLCSAPGAAGPVAVAVKRTGSGKVSNHINQNVKQGDLIEARGPSGRFTCEPEPALDRLHVLIAGGSGITPMMAIIRAILDGEPLSRIALIYGNRKQEDVIFRAQLEELAKSSKGKLNVVHALQEAPAGWTGLTGVLDPATLGKALELAGAQNDSRYYLCGPQPMMDGARQLLLDRGVPPGEVLEERFSVPVHTVSANGAQPVTFIQGGEQKVVEVPPNQTILEAALANGLQLDHSCTIGVCGTCILKKRSGAVQMNEGHCLSDGEMAAGYVLVCCAHPTEPTEIEVES